MNPVVSAAAGGGTHADHPPETTETAEIQSVGVPALSRPVSSLKTAANATKTMFKGRPRGIRWRPDVVRTDTHGKIAAALQKAEPIF